MKHFYIFWIFYRPIAFRGGLIAMMLAAIMGVDGMTDSGMIESSGILDTILNVMKVMFNKKWMIYTAIYFLPMTLLAHLLTYEMMNPQKLYFFYGLGWDKIKLWLATFLAGLTITLTITFLL